MERILEGNKMKKFFILSAIVAWFGCDGARAQKIPVYFADSPTRGHYEFYTLDTSLTLDTVSKTIKVSQQPVQTITLKDNVFIPTAPQTSFTVPPGNILFVHRNGVYQTNTQDYTISGSVVTFLTASTPQQGDVVVITTAPQSNVILARQVRPQGDFELWTLNNRKLIALLPSPEILAIATTWPMAQLQ